jgi:hypothetical protein
MAARGWLSRGTWPRPYPGAFKNSLIDLNQEGSFGDRISSLLTTQGPFILYSLLLTLGIKIIQQKQHHMYSED